jgi:hypothetical protein
MEKKDQGKEGCREEEPAGVHWCWHQMHRTHTHTQALIRGEVLGVFRRGRDSVCCRRGSAKRWVGITCPCPGPVCVTV